MRRRLKTSQNVVGFIGIAVLITALLFALLHFFFSPQQVKWHGKLEMEKDFRKNETLIFIIKDYLIESEYDEIYIPFYKETGMMFAGLNNGDVSIDDAKVVETIELLRKRGYISISKTDNCIEFLRWANKVLYKGIAYSINGHVPEETSFGFLTKIEQLSEDGWYYYEENLDEHETRNDNMK